MNKGGCNENAGTEMFAGEKDLGGDSEPGDLLGGDWECST